MSEVRKLGETGGHYSEVGNVPSEQSGRMAADSRCLSDHRGVVDPSHVSSSVQEPFSEVDNVSSRIFDRMEAIEHPDQFMELPPNATPLFGRGTVGGNGVSPQGAPSQAGQAPDGWVLVRADRIMSGAEASEETQPADSEDAARIRPNPNRVDITYKAAQRRSQLPEGAEPIEGAPASVNEESMLASIRELMVEQKRDFNKNAFPELEPVGAAPASLPETDGDGYMERVEEYEEVAQGKFKTALVKFVRTDTVLAISLSVWASLFLMIFIEPELSQALAIISLILLGIFRVMQPNRQKRKVVRVVKRKRARDNDDLALEDAILCQQA